MDDDLVELIREIGATLGQAQAMNRANQYILMEVVRDLARAQPDPEKYLSGMFERISARADHGPIEDEAHPVTAEFRETILTFFAKARHRIVREG